MANETEDEEEVMKDGKAEDDRHWWTGGACPPGCWQVVYLAIGVVRVPLWRSHKYSELSTVQCRVVQCRVDLRKRASCRTSWGPAATSPSTVFSKRARDRCWGDRWTGG